MKLFDVSIADQFPNFFCHEVSFLAPVSDQDSTGEPTTRVEPVEGLQNIPCVIGDKPAARISTQTENFGTQEDLIRVLIAGVYPSLQVGMQATLDGGDPHKVYQVQPNQSGDVTELLLSWWY